MKKEVIFSGILLLLGSMFYGLHSIIDLVILAEILWLIGVLFLVAGVLHFIGSTVLPLLEYRARILGKFKKKSILNKNK